jgi:hypothetical protein
MMHNIEKLANHGYAQSDSQTVPNIALQPLGFELHKQKRFGF